MVEEGQPEGESQGTESRSEIETSVVGLLLPMARLEGSGCKTSGLPVEPLGWQGASAELAYGHVNPFTNLFILIFFSLLLKRTLYLLVCSIC